MKRLLLVMMLVLVFAPAIVSAQAPDTPVVPDKDMDMVVIAGTASSTTAELETFVVNLLELVPTVTYAGVLIMALGQLLKLANILFAPQQQWNYRLINLVLNAIIALLMWVFTALGQGEQFMAQITSFGDVLATVAPFILQLFGGTVVADAAFHGLKRINTPGVFLQSEGLNGTSTLPTQSDSPHATRATVG